MRTARRMILFCGVALLNIVSTLLPVWPMRYHILAHRLPVSYILAAQHVTLLMGITMLLVAYPTAERHRGSAQIFMACAAVAIGANIVKGLDVEEAALNLVALVVLVMGQGALETYRLRYTVVDLARLGLALAAITAAYRVIGETVLEGLYLLVMRSRTAFPQPVRFVHVLTAKLPLQLRWFDESQVLLPVFVVGVFLAFCWTSLMQSRDTEHAEDDLYQRFGRASHNSLAYIARRSDVITFMDPGGRGAIAYRQVGRVALQIGAILASPVDRLAVYQAFVAFCRSERLIPAAVALSQDERPIVCAAGMRTLTIGTEAVVDLADFALDRLGKKMRWVQRSLSRRGYTCQLISAAEIPAQLRVALDHIDEEWRAARGGQLHGCCMTLGRFPTHADPDCLVAVARNGEGVPVAYLTLLPGGDGVYSLDLTRRSQSAPNAIMELLVIEGLSQLRAQGAGTVSLNFSTFSSLASTPGGNAMLRLVGKWFQLGTLEAFNAKFRPRWVPRYAAFPSWFYLPDVAYAIMSIEGVNRMVFNAWSRGVRGHAPWRSQPHMGPRLSSEGVYR